LAIISYTKLTHFYHPNKATQVALHHLHHVCVSIPGATPTKGAKEVGIFGEAQGQRFATERALCGQLCACCA